MNDSPRTRTLSSKGKIPQEQSPNRGLHSKSPRTAGGSEPNPGCAARIKLPGRGVKERRSGPLDPAQTGGHSVAPGVWHVPIHTQQGRQPSPKTARSFLAKCLPRAGSCHFLQLSRALTIKGRKCLGRQMGHKPRQAQSPPEPCSPAQQPPRLCLNLTVPVKVVPRFHLSGDFYWHIIQLKREVNRETGITDTLEGGRRLV